MKKLIFIIPVLLILPSYADIASGASSATCDSTTIGATEDSTDLEAQWNANTITINWYNGNTKITTNTCSYDGAVTIPATPSKPGYIFNGWRVRAAAAPVVYTKCYNIPDATTCGQYSDHGCGWANGECDLVNESSAPNAAWCDAKNPHPSMGYPGWNHCGYCSYYPDDPC